MTITRFKWGPHLKGLTGAPTVATPEIEETRIRMLEASHALTVMTVTGPVGAGKSFATARAAEACAADPVLATEILHVELASSATEREVLIDLMVQLTGVEPRANRPVRDLRHELSDILEETHRVLILDEAQHLSQKRLHGLRWLYDVPTCDFTIVLVGTPPLLRYLSDEMDSRCARRVRIEPISDDEITGNLSAYDPLFTAVEPAVLERMNRELSRGRWRWWAQFLYTARLYTTAADAGLDDPDVLAAVIEALT